MCARGCRSQCRRKWVHRGRALGEPQSTSWFFGGVIAPCFPYSTAHQSKMPGKKEGKKKENRQNERTRNVQQEKRPKDRIVFRQEMVDNDRNEKEKQRGKEWRPTLAALLEVPLLAACPAMRWVSLWKPRCPAVRPTGRQTGRTFACSSGEILGATVPQHCFSTPLFQSPLSVALPILRVVGVLVYRMHTRALITDGI